MDKLMSIIVGVILISIVICLLITLGWYLPIFLAYIGTEGCFALVLILITISIISWMRKLPKQKK